MYVAKLMIVNHHQCMTLEAITSCHFEGYGPQLLLFFLKSGSLIFRYEIFRLKYYTKYMNVNNLKLHGNLTLAIT